MKLIETTHGTINPITAEIIRYALLSIPNQIDVNITRTAYSPLVYEYKDYAVGIVDPEGRLISQSQGGIPLFVANALGAPPHLPETAERTVLPGVAVGLVLGWQAAVALMTASVVAGAVWMLACRLWNRLPRITPTALLAAGVFAWILLWARLVERWPLLG